MDVLAVAPVAVLAETLSVVAEEPDVGVRFRKEVLGSCDQLADPMIREPHFTRVAVSPLPAGGALPLGGLGWNVLLVEVEGVMGLTVVNPDEEGAVGG